MAWRTTSAAVVWCVMLIGTTLFPQRAAAQSAAERPAPRTDTDSSEMVPFQLVHAPFLMAYVDVRVQGDQYLLPLSQIFAELQVEHRLDVRSATLRLGKRSLEIPRARARLTALDAYVTPATFDSLTGLHVELSTGSLTLVISSTVELPVTTSGRLAQSRPREADATADSTAPMLHPRNRRLIGAGVAEYVATTTGTLREQHRTLDLLVGGEIAGGEFAVRARGSSPATGRPSFEGTDARWRFVPGRGPVTQLSVGRQSTGSIQPFTFDGVEVTNRPVAPRANSGLHLLEGEARPDWLVEIFVNDRLSGSGRADALGRWRVGVPVAYGSSTVRLRYTGPNGEVREEERVLQVPFGLIPTGTMEYSLAGGRLQDGAGDVLHSAAAYGVNQWLTIRGGFDATRSDTLNTRLALSRPGATNATVAYGGLTARIAGVANIGLEAAPSVVSRASFEVRTRSQATLSFTGAHWGREAGIMAAGSRFDANGHAWLPLRIRTMPVTARLSSSMRALRDGGAQRMAGAELGMQLGAFAPSFQYRVEERRMVSGDAAAAGTPDVLSQRELRVAMQLFVGRMLPQPFRNAFVRAAVGGDLTAHRIRSMEAYAGRPVGRRAQTEISWVRDGLTGVQRLETRLFVRLGAARVASSATYGPRQTVVSQSAAGTLAFDAGAKRLLFTERPLIGRAGASVRLFLDANGNGRLDGEETELRDARVRISGGLPFDGHGSRVSDLLSYGRYVAHVDKSTLANPLWIPAHDAIAFVADPNRMKSIDVPLYPGASVEGRVRRVNDQANDSTGTPADTGRAVPGVRLHLLREDGGVSITLPTFADGAFYHPGLPPGNYVLQVDPGQLERLGMVASPAQRRFTVVPSADGLMLDGLGFLLREAPRKTPAPP